MSEPIVYSLKLSSYNTIGAVAVASSAANADITYDVGRFFAKIAAVHGVTKCKIEVEGCVMPSDLMQLIGTFEGAIAFVVKCPNLITTSWDATNLAYPTIGCFMATNGGFDKNENIDISYKNPIYLSNIANVSKFEVIQYDGYTNALISSSATTAHPEYGYGVPYTLMLHITPLYS